MGFRTKKKIMGAVVMLGITVLATKVAAETDAPSTEKAHMHMAKIMNANDAQVALTINKDMSLEVLGVRAGELVEPCKKEDGGDCHFDQDKVFSQETLTITVIEDSCCAYISTGNDTYEFCPPQWPLEFVNAISGESCPRYE